MARKLTKLRIDEVSLCLKGAGEGTRVLIQKNHDGASHRETLRKWFGSIDFSKVQIVAPDDIADDGYDDDDRDRERDDTLPRDEEPDDDDIETPLPDDDEGTLHPKLEEMVASLQTANPAMTRAECVHYISHSHNGRAWARHMAEITKTRKDNPMERIDQLKEFAKQQGGMTAVVKHVLTKGTTAVTEHEFTAMLMEHAKLNKAAGESDTAAFSRIFSSPDAVDLRRAHAITKNTPTNVVDLKPAQVSRDDVVDADDSAKAYQKLEKMAGELRTRSPELSEAQSFAKVFESNPELASRAHRRPSATTSYAFPR